MTAENSGRAFSFRPEVLVMVNWERHLRYQERAGWCGPAVIQMLLSASKIRQSQSAIARAVYKEWFGSSHPLMIAYLSKFFGTVNFSENSRTTDIARLLKDKQMVFVNWWDDIGPSSPDGHYSIVSRIFTTRAGYKYIELVDPSNERAGIWKLDLEAFSTKWHDYVDKSKQIRVNRWLEWIDPASKIV